MGKHKWRAQAHGDPLFSHSGSLQHVSVDTPLCTSKVHPHPWSPLGLRAVPTKKATQALEWAQSSLGGEFQGPGGPEHG